MTRTGVPVPVFRSLKSADRTEPGRHLLGVVSFSSDAVDAQSGSAHASVGVHLTESPEEGFAEVWTSASPPVTGGSGAIRYAHDGEVLFGAVRIPELPDYVAATDDVYTQLLDLVEQLGYPQIFRIWHYISRLNEDNAAGMEVYREFCVGRARALERRGRTHDMPAATVVGAHGGGIVLYFLACGDGTQVNIDNPRQVPPYHYPSHYGPKAPNFARATYLLRGGEERVFVSGTAGILGHRTMHPGDVEAQTRLALDNIAHVIGAGNLSGHGLAVGGTLHDLRAVKVYVRRQADIAKVQPIIRQALAADVDVVFLHADICRSDLLVELEGVVAAVRAADLTDPAARTPLPSLWEARPAEQQPDWRGNPAYPAVREALRAAPPLVGPAELAELRHQLAQVALGRARVLQAGDCAESFYESTAQHTRQKIETLLGLAERMHLRGETPVVAVGRLGGQYAKPRSHTHETVDGVELPVFRGHLVNAESASPEARAHDPRRMLWAYHFSSDVIAALRERRAAARTPDAAGPWSSHDAVLLDYLGPLLRTDPATGDLFLSATHLPWIGERTNSPDGPHVNLLARVSNPVACKVGPTATPEALLRLCEALDPGRTAGRLTLIVRMGRERIGALLPPLVRAVRAAGHPVVWLSDPMHGNTLRLPSGAKLRSLEDLVAEAAACRSVLEAEGCHFGGLHLETAAEPVTECVGGPPAEPPGAAVGSTTLCDPRLNPGQAAELIDRVLRNPNS